MNRLSVAIEGDGLRVAGVLLRLDCERRTACLAAGIDSLGIRPEDVRLVAPSEPEALAGEVYVVEPIGNETLVDVRIGDERIVARAPRGFDARIGSTVGVAFDPADACFFDAAGSTAVHRTANKGGMK